MSFCSHSQTEHFWELHILCWAQKGHSRFMLILKVEKYGVRCKPTVRRPLTYHQGLNFVADHFVQLQQVLHRSTRAVQVATDLPRLLYLTN